VSGENSSEAPAYRLSASVLTMLFTPIQVLKILLWGIFRASDYVSAVCVCISLSSPAIGYDGTALLAIQKMTNISGSHSRVAVKDCVLFGDLCQFVRSVLGILIVCVLSPLLRHLLMASLARRTTHPVSTGYTAKITLFFPKKDLTDIHACISP
jgi:hypothetical protein